MSSIPLVDLAGQHRQVADRVLEGFAAVLAETSFVQGKQVEAFEREYADFLGVRHCVGVANGTDAIELALRAAGIGAGDEVVLPANTFIATAEAAARAGARPVPVDVDERYLLIDPERTAAAVTTRTRAIVPVHLYGQAAPLEEIRGIADRAGIPMIEDAAQSQGATRHGRSAGGWGLAGATSFYPGKNLGAYGDAGAVVTDSDEVADRVRALGNHGSAEKYRHPLLGFNSRLDTLQAVVLCAKLAELPRWNESRRRAATRYDELLAGVEGVRRPEAMPGNEHVWHLYVVRVPRRDQVLDQLRDAGVGAGIHYPVPLHLQGAFADLGYGPGSFPVTEAAAGEILSLPLYPGITQAQQERVVAALTSALAVR